MFGSLQLKTEKIIIFSETQKKLLKKGTKVYDFISICDKLLNKTYIKVIQIGRN
jgi:hypothetical protein